MATRSVLDGSALPIRIAPGGFSLQAPGVKGAVTAMTTPESATRADGGLYEADLMTALGHANIHSGRVFEIDVTSVAPPAQAGAARADSVLRTRDNEPAMALRAPRLGKDTEQAVLYTDEEGVSRWVFAEADDAPRHGSGSRGPQSDLVFLLPRDNAPPTAELEARAGSRGPLTKLGRRLVRLLAWATQDMIGMGALAVAAAWEQERRSYGFVRAPFGDVRPFSWNELSGGRALLLIHGTFSTAQSAFSMLPSATWDRLEEIYGGRIFAFNHPTLSHSPGQNIQQFLDMLPPGIELTLDILTHSRGGLVVRELTERVTEHQRGERRIAVEKVVFVGTPHRGTNLTNSEHGIEMLDRYTNLVTELPDTSFTVAMEGVFMLAKLLYHGAMVALPGLRSMFPPGEYLQHLNVASHHRTQYYAVAADFKPRGNSALSRFRWTVVDPLVDSLFGEPNDGVVPTDGAYRLQTEVPGFSIPMERRIIFGAHDQIHHCNYFAAPAVSAHVIAWLEDGPPLHAGHA